MHAERRLALILTFQGYEPYILVLREHVPWYDERFRGYGRDKIVHLMHLAGGDFVGLHQGGLACRLALKVMKDLQTRVSQGRAACCGTTPPPPPYSLLCSTGHGLRCPPQ